jgi:hypothetical protein
MPGVGATVYPSPSGSAATDTTYAITDSNLNLLSNAAKSSLLSVSNLGSAITSRINSTLELIQAYDEFTAYLLDETVLNGLANGATSSTLNVANVGTSNFVKVIVILGEITPVGLAPSVFIDSGLESYELAVGTTTAKKRLEFNQIPAAFVNAFTVTNNLGVSLASSGNSIVVVGL